MKRKLNLSDAIDHATKALVDKGLLIEAGWTSLRMMSMPQNAPQVQIDEMRNAFFAGAHHVFFSMMAVLDEGDDVTEQDLNRVSQIHAELDRFLAEFKRHHGMDN